MYIIPLFVSYAKSNRLTGACFPKYSYFILCASSPRSFNKRFAIFFKDGRLFLGGRGEGEDEVELEEAADSA